MSEYVTLVSLGGTIVLCLLGIAHCAYRQHNALQNLGMLLTAIGCGAKLWGDPAYVPVAHVGVFCFAVGHAYRVYKFRPSKPKSGPPTEMPTEKLRHVAGGMKE